jgi:hypothetical protein
MLLHEAGPDVGGKAQGLAKTADTVGTMPEDEISVLASRDAAVPTEEPKEPPKEQSEEVRPRDSAQILDDPPVYISSEQVSVKPVLLVDVPPTLAGEIAHDLSSVVLNLLINEQGKVDRVIVEDESLPQTTRQTLVEGFSKVQFTPALMQERPVKIRLRIELSVGENSVLQ